MGAKTGGAEPDLSLEDNGSISGAGGGEDIVGESNRIVVQSPRQAHNHAKAPDGNANLIDLIEKPGETGGAVGVFIDNQLRQGRAVGSVLDTKIRDMEQKGQVMQGKLTPHVMDSPYSGHNIVDSPEKGAQKKTKKRK